MTKTIAPDVAAIAATVRAELARKSVSQVAVASRLGLSQAAVSRRLLGQVPMLASEVLLVADLLGVEPAELLRAAS